MRKVAYLDEVDAIYELLDVCPVLHGSRDERDCVCREVAEMLWCWSVMDATR